jgi:hypothetical protein
MEDIIEFQKAQIEALRLEIDRLNNDLCAVKLIANKSRLTDPNFLKPLSHLNVDYETINAKKQ